MTIGAAVCAKLDRARDLMSHAVRGADLERVLDRALDLLVAKLEKQRLGRTAADSASRATPSREPPACKTAGDSVSPTATATATELARLAEDSVSSAATATQPPGRLAGSTPAPERLAAPSTPER